MKINLDLLKDIREGGTSKVYVGHIDVVSSRSKLTAKEENVVKDARDTDTALKEVDEVVDELILDPRVVELATYPVIDNQFTNPPVVDSTLTPLSQNTGLPSEEIFNSDNSLNSSFNIGEDDEEDSTDEDLDICSDEEEFIATLEGIDVA